MAPLTLLLFGGSISPPLDQKPHEGLHLVHLAQGGGKPLNTPRHLGDSRQSGSANEHPRLGPQKGWVPGREQEERSFTGSFVYTSISSFSPD